MKKIEKEYNKRFSNQQLPSSDFDIDGLWDSISDNLDAVPPHTPSAWWSSKWILGLIFVGAFSAALVCYHFNVENKFYANNIDKKEVIVENKINFQENFEYNNTAKNSTNSTVDIISPRSNKIESLKNNQVTTSIKDYGKSVVKIGVNSDNNSIYPSSEKNVLQIKSNLSKRLQNSTSESLYDPEIIKDSNLASSTEKYLVQENKNVVKAAGSQEIANQAFFKNDLAIGLTLQSLPVEIALLVADERKQKFPKVNNLQNKISLDKQKAFSWQFSLFGGANNFLLNYSSTEAPLLADLKDQSNTGMWGYNIGFKTALVLNNSWVFSSGLEYQNLYSRFELNTVKSTQVLVEDTIIKVWIDSNTGEVLNSVIGDALVDATTTRTVVHHNTFQQFTIPFDIGYQTVRRSFIYGLHAGASLNYITAQSGRTLSLDEEFVSFDSNSDYTPFRSFHIGLRLSPLVGYQLSNTWALTLQPLWAWNPNAGIDNSIIKLKVHQINFNVGLRYTL